MIVNAGFILVLLSPLAEDVDSDRKRMVLTPVSCGGDDAVVLVEFSEDMDTGLKSLDTAASLFVCLRTIGTVPVLGRVEAEDGEDMAEVMDEKYIDDVLEDGAELPDGRRLSRVLEVDHELNGVRRELVLSRSASFSRSPLT